jgi:hypothetical protein
VAATACHHTLRRQQVLDSIHVPYPLCYYIGVPRSRMSRRGHCHGNQVWPHPRSPAVTPSLPCAACSGAHRISPCPGQIGDIIEIPTSLLKSGLPHSMPRSLNCRKFSLGSVTISLQICRCARANVHWWAVANDRFCRFSCGLDARFTSFASPPYIIWPAGNRMESVSLVNRHPGPRTETHQACSWAGG